MTQTAIAEQIVELFLREGEAARVTGQDSKGRPTTTVVNKCGRCGGEGRSNAWAMTGYTCYQCGGSGKGSTQHPRLYTVAELEKLNTTRDKILAKKEEAYTKAKTEREAAETQAREHRRASLAADPFFQAFAEFIKPHLLAEPDQQNEFLISMWARIAIQDLTPAQQGAVQKFMDSAKARQERIASARHVGTVGERFKFEGEITFVRCLREATSYMSGKYLIKIKTTEGDMLTYFGSRWLRQGAIVAGAATISEHSSYQGEAQTTIKNPRFTKGADDDED